MNMYGHLQDPSSRGQVDLSSNAQKCNLDYGFEKLWVLIHLQVKDTVRRPFLCYSLLQPHLYHIKVLQTLTEDG